MPEILEPQISEDRPLNRSVNRLGERFAAIQAEVRHLKFALGGSDKLKPTSGDAPVVKLEAVLDHIALRSSRSDLFGSRVFSDPAWDLLLAAFAAYLQTKKLTISEFCSSFEMPPSTAHRWMKKLIDDGLLERRGDPFDARLTWLDLSSKAIDGLNRYFVALEARSSSVSLRNSPSK